MQRIIKKAHEDLKLLLEKGGNISCDTCKGSGEITFTVSTFGEPDSETQTKMSCLACSGKGLFMLSSEKDQSDWVSAQIEKTMWCQCEDHMDFYYRDNNKCPGCVRKHHYHCKKSGLIPQRG